MSKHHYLKTKRKISLEKIYAKAKEKFPELQFQIYKNGVSYAWLEGISTRGINISKEDIGYEFRTTSGSCYEEFELINELAKMMYCQCGGTMYNEDEDVVAGDQIYPSNSIMSEVNDPLHAIHILTGEGTPITLFCPNGIEVHFGPETHRRIQHLAEDKNQLGAAMISLMRKVIYDLPWENSGNAMEISNEDGTEKFIAKLISPECDYVLSKYDYLLIYRQNELPIRITNDTLKLILPKSWELIDDYTVLAPALSISEFEELKREALKYEIPFE